MFELAYIDGATGGMALQVILGSIAGSLVVFKLAFRSVMARFGRRGSDEDDEPLEDASVVDEASR